MAVQQTKQGRTRHGVRCMRAAESIRVADIVMNQMQRIQRRLMRRAQTAYEGFEYSAADEITQPNSDSKTDYDQQHGLPVAVLPQDKTD